MVLPTPSAKICRSTARRRLGVARWRAGIRWRRRRLLALARWVAVLGDQLLGQRVDDHLLVIGRHLRQLHRYVYRLAAAHDLQRAVGDALAALGALVLEEHVAERLVLLGDLHV